MPFYETVITPRSPEIPLGIGCIGRRYGNGKNILIENAKAMAKELRKMARAKDEYWRFTYTTPWIKHIWRVSALMLEELGKRIRE